MWKLILETFGIKKYEEVFTLGASLTTLFFVGFLSAFNFDTQVIIRKCQSFSPFSDARDVDRFPAAAELPAPEFETWVPAVIKASVEGEAPVGWRKVLGAQGYLVVVRDLMGNEVKAYKAHSERIDMRDLPTSTEPFAQYMVSVACLDYKDEPGNFNEPRRLVVPQHATVRAPTIKTIKAED